MRRNKSRQTQNQNKMWATAEEPKNSRRGRTAGLPSVRPQFGPSWCECERSASRYRWPSHSTTRQTSTVSRKGPESPIARRALSFRTSQLPIALSAADRIALDASGDLTTQIKVIRVHLNWKTALPWNNSAKALKMRPTLRQSPLNWGFDFMLFIHFTFYRLKVHKRQSSSKAVPTRVRSAFSVIF